MGKRGRKSRRGKTRKKMFGGSRTMQGSVGLLAVLAGLYTVFALQAGNPHAVNLTESPESLAENTEALGEGTVNLTESPESLVESTADSAENTVEVHFIDVGQADATLIKCENAAMLIDAGEDSSGTALQNYLQKQGISRLDYLVLTHPDSDHIGGAPVVIEKFEIDTVFMSDYEKDNQTYRKLIQALDNKRLEWSKPEVGSEWSLGNASFTILAPNDTYSDPNNASIALSLRNGENTFLFTGDAEEEAEMDILGTGLSVRADVYKAGHHGSRTASCEKFVEAVSPAFAVISCGENNSYGHPHAQTMNTFRMRGIQVYRTDEQGSVVAVSDGKEITWNCAPSESWKAGEPMGSAGN